MANRIRIPLHDRFWPKVKIGAPSECWWWLAARNDSGYGVIGRPGKGGGNYRATHVAWFLTHGVWPTAQLNHTCHNGHLGCTNPAHLYDGTHTDNMRDMWAAGRGKGMTRRHIGKKNPATKLSAEQVLWIRVKHAQGATGMGLSREFKTDPKNIAFIVKRVTWGHV